MREIKFRAWDGNTMHKKVSALYPLFNRDGKFECRVDDDVKDQHITAIAIMQFTGLTDKNGKEIYEGDIVTLTINKGLPSEYTGKWEIYFGAWCYMRRNSLENSFAFDAINARSSEIIGNIYEHQNLLSL